METRRTRGKKIKREADYVVESETSNSNDIENPDDLRKSKIRDSNKEFNKRMTILQSWSRHWHAFNTREGEAYPKKEARSIIKKFKKITCPIASCGKSFTTVGGLRYHYARCNIERCFKCMVCDPQTELKTRGDLLRHMVRLHYNQLPELEDDQKEIANAYLNTSGRIDKTKSKRNTGDLEAQIGHRQIIKLYFDLAEKYRNPEGTLNCPFRNWQTLGRDWEFLTYELDRRRYYPPEKESVKFKASANSSWSVLKAGDSIALKTDDRSSPKSVIFFTGGITTSTAWLPKPPSIERVETSSELIAIAVNCCPMDRNSLYRNTKDLNGCIQFWSVRLANPIESGTNNEMKASLSFMIGHSYGVIFDMSWCPLGTSWQPPPLQDEANLDHSTQRIGLLALACGDGQVRIISVPHVETLMSKVLFRHSDNFIETTQVYRVKPIATLMPPGVGLSTDYELSACTALCWNIEDSQRIVAAGYANGTVALFDLSNYSPILYSESETRHIYQPLKSWLAHGLPVSGVAISSENFESTLIATGSRDKQLKVWSLMDLNSCLTFDRAPITKLIWDYRFKGIISSTEAAFTSFQNRVSYKFPTLDGAGHVTISSHRATVWGLSNSSITSSVATSDEAGEVFVAPNGRPVQKRDRNPLGTTHSLYTLIPQPIDNCPMDSFTNNQDTGTSRLSTTSSLLPNYTKDDLNRSQSQSITFDMTNAVANGNETLADASNDEDEEEPVAINDFTFVERNVANKPAKFLLPTEHRAVETYADFKKNFGLQFISYDSTISKKENKAPESSARACDMTNIYCDRVCDYPFSCIRNVSWSPNSETFPYLLSASHIGLCRLDRVQVVEHVYRDYIRNLKSHTS